VKDKVTPVVLLLVAVALALALRGPEGVGEEPHPGEPVPDFEFVMDGRPASLAALRGRVVVLNFWASWCPPCVEEMPSLERLHRKLGPDGLVVLGVSVDENPTVYENFLRTSGVTFPNLRDPEKRLAARYGTFMYPETYIIGRDGRLVRKIIGAQRWNDPQMVEFLNGLL
jgi:thiol-disulfide isomerase/thioredoxin